MTPPNQPSAPNPRLRLIWIPGILGAASVSRDVQQSRQVDPVAARGAEAVRTPSRCGCIADERDHYAVVSGSTLPRRRRLRNGGCQGRGRPIKMRLRATWRVGLRSQCAGKGLGAVSRGGSVTVTTEPVLWMSIPTLLKIISSRWRSGEACGKH
jgi:hypothetical protein